jgi:anti-sigma regulatory factor (Ser/Thr protein kinase)
VPRLQAVDHHCHRLVLDVMETRAEPQSVSRARAFVRRTLDAREITVDVRDTMVLMASELVTNVVRHGGGGDKSTVLLFLIRIDETLRLEVHDANRDLPVPRAAADADESGRGLLVVSSLAALWGAHPTAAGKFVFCELPIASAAESG